MGIDDFPFPSKEGEWHRPRRWRWWHQQCQRSADSFVWDLLGLGQRNQKDRCIRVESVLSQWRLHDLHLVSVCWDTSRRELGCLVLCAPQPLLQPTVHCTPSLCCSLQRPPGKRCCKSCPWRRCHVLASMALVLLYFHVGHAVSHQHPWGCAGAVAEPS